MSRFKKGDRVRITNFMTYDYGDLIGVTGTVTDLSGYGNVVTLDRAVKIHESYSLQKADLLLLLDKELEYEDNGAGTWPCDQPSLSEFLYHHGD